MKIRDMLIITGSAASQQIIRRGCKSHQQSHQSHGSGHHVKSHGSGQRMGDFLARLVIDIGFGANTDTAAISGEI